MYWPDSFVVRSMINRCVIVVVRRARSRAEDRLPASATLRMSVAIAHHCERGGGRVGMGPSPWGRRA